MFGPELSPEAQKLYAELNRAASKLEYLGVPVEARLSPSSLTQLRVLLAPLSRYQQANQDPLATYNGINLIVDRNLPDGRMEFRDGHGNIVRVIKL